MTANYYGCYGKHQEFSCLSHYYFNRRFTRDKWCANCKDRYPESVGHGR